MSDSLEYPSLPGDFKEFDEHTDLRSLYSIANAHLESSKDDTEAEKSPPVPPRHGSLLSRKTTIEMQSISNVDLTPSDETMTDVKPSEEPKTSEPEPEDEDVTIEGFSTAAKLEESERKCEILLSEVKELRKNLNDAQDFIFSLQPLRDQITESQAIAEFSSLCKSVEEWVQTNLSDPLYEKHLIKEKASLGAPAKEFISILSRSSIEAFRCQDTDDYNVVSGIMKFLCRGIFEPDFYCPVEPGAMEFLKSLGKSIANLEPRRDLIAQRAWRSETLTALVNRHEFPTQRQAQTELLTSHLTHMLHIFAPRMSKHKLDVSLQRTIIEPAMSLAHKLHLSDHKYRVEWSHLQRTRPENRPTTPAEYFPFECVDLLQPGKVLKFPAMAEGAAGRGKITYLFDLCPALVLDTVKKEFFAEPKVLVKPRILVAATKEDKGPFVVPRPVKGEPVTLLGYLEETLHAKRSRW